jgi:hypothetical protein
VNLFIDPLCLIPQGVVRPKQKSGAPPEDRNLQGHMLLRNNLMEIRPAVSPFSYNHRPITLGARHFQQMQMQAQLCMMTEFGYIANSPG